MHNLDPNEMDALFREGAEQHEFTYNEAAWSMMEEKLDRQDRRRGMYWWIFGALMLVMVSSALYFTTNNEEIQENTSSEIVALNERSSVSTSIQNTETSSDYEKNIHESSVKEISDYDNTQNTEEISIERTVIVNNGSTESSSNLIKDQGVQNEKPSERSVVNVRNLRAKIEQVPVVESTNVKGLSVVEYNEKINSGGLEEEGVTEVNKPENNVREFIVMSSLEKNDFHLIRISEYKFDALLPDPYNELQLENNENGGARFVLTTFVGGELSSVGFFQEAQRGYKVGTRAGVQFSDHFQIDFGVSFGQKKFGSVGEAYDIAGGWDQRVGVEPTWMDAKCNILEIPLEASYYFSGYKNDGFFANVGINSFYLNSEWYGFKYKDKDMMDQQQQLRLIDEITMDDIDEQNFHLLGVAKLSAGYQKIISQNMSFEIAPYLQIPLTGIGEGKVNVYSAGLQLGLKFNSK